ncbi:TIR domain-containing protein [Streptomyces sp. ME02-8801-2C]|uniref:toll/interleukin-1 receptor domain-containing protein n=1 Tax=Streptomyces sp. ME02-8801-2C TaxID=3028680 RepID=UPI0029A975C4|nr:TIR domain-containing protein [Streptomyces sp. ME02-8801-2C]MDX3454534.1 TIR domain-containing protein [Streptomyces sp. ME02-8801-2C]
MTQVFISHSSRSDPLAEKVREQISKGLAERNYEVKVDTDALKPGDDWCPTLYKWLAECDAAVILFNQEAIDSFWVRREVNILMWRRALNPGLLIIPVLIGGLTSSVLKDNGFSDVLPVEFARTSPEVADETAVERLVNQVLEEFGTLPDLSGEPDSMRKWIGVIADYLERTDKKAALTEAGRALGIADEHLQNNAQAGVGQFLAQQMLDAAPGEHLKKALWKIAPYLDGDSLQRLITQVTPAWISGEVARHILPPVPGDASHRRTVALNACESGTARQFVDRAMCLDFGHYWIGAAGGVPVGEDLVLETLDQCFSAVRRILGMPPDWPLEKLRFRPDCFHFLTLAMHKLKPETVAEVVEELHRVVPQLIIILLTGDNPSTAESLREFRLDEVIVLSPPLGPDEETLGFQLAHDLRSIPDRLNGYGGN